jgi:hypothetical protein
VSGGIEVLEKGSDGAAEIGNWLSAIRASEGWTRTWLTGISYRDLFVGLDGL